MTVPELADAPVTFVCVTVQAKVAPPVVLLMVTELVLPEQIDCEDGVAVTVGIGFTVTTAVMAVPGHPPAVGVIV